MRQKTPGNRRLTNEHNQLGSAYPRTTMKPLLLRNLESRQLHIPLAPGYQIFLAPRSLSTEAQLQFEDVNQWAFGRYAHVGPELLLQQLNKRLALLGCLVDHRVGFLPRLFCAPECFALVQYGVTETQLCETARGDRWQPHELHSTPLRIIGGDSVWIEDLGEQTLRDLVADTPRDTDLNQVLFTIAKERHCLGYDDPTPFLFGVDQFENPSLT